MSPETDFEVRAPFPDSVGNVLFTCGSYEHGGEIYIIYGAGDSYIMAARIHRDALLNRLRGSAMKNPYSRQM